MSEFFHRSSEYGGLIRNIYSIDDISDDEKMCIKQIFYMNSGENGFLRDSEALEKSQGVSYLTIPYTRKIVGYALYSVYTEDTFLEEKDTLWDVNYIPSGIYINQVAMSKEYQNRGYAIVMYMDILNNNQEIDKLYAHVAIRNIQSMKFHCRHRFVPIGEYVSDDFHGIKNYKSVLLEYQKKTIFNINQF